jgi:hypothetical protein
MASKDNFVEIDFKQPDNGAPKIVSAEERTREGLILPDSTVFHLLIIVYMVFLTMTSFALMVMTPIVIYSYIAFETMKQEDQDGVLRYILLLMIGINLIVTVNNVIGWTALRTMLMKYLYLNVALKCISMITTLLFAFLIKGTAVWICLAVEVPVLVVSIGIVWQMRKANREPRYPIESLFVNQ